MVDGIPSLIGVSTDCNDDGAIAGMDEEKDTDDDEEKDEDWTDRNDKRIGVDEGNDDDGGNNEDEGKVDEDDNLPIDDGNVFGSESVRNDFIDEEEEEEEDHGRSIF